jgi:hypothetical protein
MISQVRIDDFGYYRLITKIVLDHGRSDVKILIFIELCT